MAKGKSHIKNRGNGKILPLKNLETPALGVKGFARRAGVLGLMKEERMKKRLIVLTAIMGIVALMVAATVLASEQPTYDVATVDGDYGEWNLNEDFFAYMYRAGNPDKPVESSLYLRYDCETKVMFGLVLANTPTATVQVDGNEEHWLKIDRSVVVDEQAGLDGTPPDFAWIGLENGTALGWEASADVTAGSHTIQAHTITDDGEFQTSATIPLSLTIDCGSTSVELTSFTAQSGEDSNEGSGPPLLLILITGALLGLVFWVASRFGP